MNDQPLRFAVIGAGHIAQVAVLPAFEHAENAKLAAIVSGDPEKRDLLGQRHEVPAVDYAECGRLLSSDEVDAVYIAVPNHLHAHYAQLAAKHGKHVLCEKPMAPTEEDCQQMIAACNDAGVRLMIAYRLHFEPAHMRAVELVQRGTIGRPVYFTSAFSQDVSPGDIRLVATERGGGPMFDQGVYCINAARYLFGADPIETRAFATRRPRDDRFDQCDETVSAVLDFGEGRMAMVTASFGAYRTSRLQIVGDGGAISMQPAYGYTTGLSLQVEPSDGEPYTEAFERSDQFAAQIVEFVQCVQQERKPEPDGREGQMDVRILRAIHRSTMTGHAVEIEPIPMHARPGPHQVHTRPPVENKPAEINASSPSS
jgi:glucose-fructose oxidoreductase